MKILQVAPCDFAGVAVELSAAINTYCQDQNVECRVLARRGHSLRFATDIVTQDRQEWRRWLQWADVLHVHRRWGIIDMAKVDVSNKLLLMMFHGSMYRREHDAHNRASRKRGVRQIYVSTPDLTAWGATWLPTCMPARDHAMLARRVRHVRNKRNIVAQAPSNLVRKSTKEVARQVKSVKEAEWRCIVKTPHKRTLALKAEAKIGIDQFEYGIGRNGLEFMAMGIPVIAHAVPWVEKRIKACVGYLPYYDCPLNKVAKAVRLLLSDQELYNQYAELGRKYIAEFHDSQVVAEKYVRQLIKLRGG